MAVTCTCKMLAPESQLESLTYMYEVGFTGVSFLVYFALVVYFVVVILQQCDGLLVRVGFTHITVPFYQQIIKNLTVLPLLTVYCK